jgi:hypothetical protein
MVQGLVAEHIVNANESREVVSSDPMLESLDALVAERIVDNQTALKAQLTSGSGGASSSSSGGPRYQYCPNSSFNFRTGSS